MTNINTFYALNFDAKLGYYRYTSKPTCCNLEDPAQSAKWCTTSCGQWSSQSGQHCNKQWPVQCLACQTCTPTEQQTPVTTVSWDTTNVLHQVNPCGKLTGVSTKSEIAWYNECNRQWYNQHCCKSSNLM